MLQQQRFEGSNEIRPVVTISTPDAASLLPALVLAGGSVLLKRNKLAVRGLSATQVARAAAAQLVPVTDLTISMPERDDEESS